MGNGSVHPGDSSGALRHPARNDAAIVSGPTAEDARRHRRFVVTFALTTLAGLFGMAAFNVAMDPFGAFGVTLIPADSRTGDTRTARAELLRRFTGETVLIGSSRTRVAYDGRHPALPGGPACNVGLDGTHLSELLLVVEHAVANPHVRRVVLSLDVHLAAAAWTPNADYKCSRFNPDRSKLAHACDLLWNQRTCEASLRAIKRLARGEPAQHDDLGFAERAALRFERATPAARTAAALEQFCGERAEMTRLLPPEESRAQLQQMIDLCRMADVELTIVIDPVHALLSEGRRATGQWDEYVAWKADVVDCAAAAGVTVWDFTEYSHYTTEPLLADDAPPSEWFWEPSHMRRELGDRVLARIFGAADADPHFGGRVTSESWAAQCEAMEVARRAWLHSSDGESTRLVEWRQRRQSTASIAAHGSDRPLR
jgi:hypothetical protein